jgi:hypothetical protein
MRDTMKPFRKAIHQTLSGNVIYKGSQVKIYDEKIFTGDQPNLYVLYSTQRETDITETDCAWETRSSIDILIINRTQSETSKDALDDISDSILILLLNLPHSDNLVTQSGFLIQEVKKDSAVSGLIQISPTETILQKQMTISAIITQQS